MFQLSSPGVASLPELASAITMKYDGHPSGRENLPDIGIAKASEIQVPSRWVIISMGTHGIS